MNEWINMSLNEFMTATNQLIAKVLSSLDPATHFATIKWLVATAASSEVPN